jgi:hypothetical protein
VQGFQGLATRPNAHPRGLLNLLAGHIKSQCREDFVGQSLGDAKIDGADASVAIIGCGKLRQDQPGGLKAGDGEAALYVALKGTNDMYVIHKSFRDGRIAPDAFSPEMLRLLLLTLQPIKLCDRSESHPECYRPQR